MNPTLPSGRLPTSSSQQNGSTSKSPPSLREKFRKFSGAVATAVGSPIAFTLAVLAIVIWAILGPHYKYSDTWQLVINTGTTIVTFLMVFLIQNTQNRDARAIHLKLDELIRGVKGARNRMVDLEECTEEELNQLEQEFRRIRQKHQSQHETRTQSGSHNGGSQAPKQMQR